MKNVALLIIDIQNDFCPGGALPVEDGDKIIPHVNRYIELFEKNDLPIFTSRDWHPADSKHFKKFGGLWPVHCVQETEGARFHPDLKLSKRSIIISSGINPNEDGYSCFEGYDALGIPLGNILKGMGITQLFICGIATDYCVKHSTLEALKNNFTVFVLSDAIKGVNVNPGDSEKALKEMVEKGAQCLTYDEVSKQIS